MKFFWLKKNTLGIEGSYLNVIKTTYETLTANIILNGKEDWNQEQTRMQLLLVLFSTVLEVQGRVISQQKKLEIRKNEVKLSAEYMALCVENTNDLHTPQIC